MSSQIPLARPPFAFSASMAGQEGHAGGEGVVYSLSQRVLPTTLTTPTSFHKEKHRNDSCRERLRQRVGRGARNKVYCTALGAQIMAIAGNLRMPAQAHQSLGWHTKHHTRLPSPNLRSVALADCAGSTSNVLHDAVLQITKPVYSVFPVSRAEHKQYLCLPVSAPTQWGRKRR